jgi:hypothetical protein
LNASGAAFSRRGVIAPLWFILLSASLYPAPFAHKTHLALKLECVACHASIPASTKVEDNNLPEKAVCLGCHAEASIKAPRETRLARFSHRTHTKLGNIAPVLRAAVASGVYLAPPGNLRNQLTGTNACLACHRGIDQSVETGNAHFPHMADCLVCHNKIDPPDSCQFCHAGDQNLKPATHTPDYLDRHTSGKGLDRSTCATCHGRRFTCLGCH